MLLQAERRSRGRPGSANGRPAGDRGCPSAQGLRVDGRGGRRELHRPPGRDLRDPRPQRRRQDHDGRVHHRAANRPIGARSACSVSTRAATGASCTSASACSSRKARCRSCMRVGRGGGALRLVLPRARRRARADRDARARATPGTLLQAPVGRSEAAPVDRARADRAARDRGPRRADHRPRPGGAPRHLDADRRGPRPRGDDRAGDPLHGGGRAAV